MRTPLLAMQQPHSRRLDRFDVHVVAVILILLLAIAMIVVRGDQVGLDVKTFEPLESASSRSPIQAAFDETVDPASVKSHFTITPNVAGTWTLADKQATFRPTTPLVPG